MKRRHSWFGTGAFFSTIVATFMGLLGLAQQASADRTVPPELEEQYAQQVVAAEAKANGGQFAEALQTIEGIPTNSRYFSELEQKQQMWAKLLLQQAREVSQRGEPQKAVALLRPLASRPNLAPEAQRLSEQWQRQSALLAELESAQSRQDWTGVLRSIETIRTVDSDLANTPKLQEINQIATEKAFTLAEIGTAEATKTVKPIATPASFTSELIGLGSPVSPINIEIAPTVINPSEVEKHIRPDKPVAVVNPQPMPMPLSVASAKPLKQVSLASLPASQSSASGSVSEVPATPPASPTSEPLDSVIESAPVQTVPIVPAAPLNSTVQDPQSTTPAEPEMSGTEASPAISFETVQKETQPKTDYGSVVQ